MIAPVMHRNPFHRRSPGAVLLFCAVVSAQGEDAKPPQQQGPPPSIVRLGEVKRERIRNRRFVTGEVRPVRSSAVAGREPGLVAAIEVLEGQSVEPGTVIARVDATPLKLEVARRKADRAEAQATLQQFRASLDLARWQRDAQRELQKRGSSYERELREAESAVLSLEARCSQAEAAVAVIDAELAELEQRLADTVIRAPFAGVVVTRLIGVGGWLAAGGAVVELLSATHLEAWLQVPENLAAGLTSGEEQLELYFEALDQRRTVDGFRIVPRIDPRTRTFPLVVTLPEAQGLKPGMSASAWVAAGATGEHLTVPKDALLRNEIGYYVYVARGGGPGPAKAMPVGVERLFAHGDRVAVRTQLRGGEQVVVEGNERLFPGAPILPTGAVPATHEKGK